MAGGLIQLVAYGVQDLYLTGDPQITFFKVVYRRHTNFAIESVPQYFSSPVNFGETVSCTISRAGDLIGRIFLYVEIPDIPKFINSDDEESMFKKFAWTKSLGYALIQEIYIEIGGRLIDKQYGEWLYIWSQVSNRQDIALNKMIGNIPQMYHFTNGKSSYRLYIPLEFWFCRHTGLALPLIALASSEVKITVTFRNLEECCRIGPTHSVEILEDIIPFHQGDYIEQTVNGQIIRGYCMGYDYLHKKLYYIKIQSPTANKKTFESYQEDISLGHQPKQISGFNPIPNRIFNNPKNHSIASIPKEILDDPTYSKNLPYRIYNSITKSYCTPRPNTREYIEQTTLPSQPRLSNAFFYVDYVYLDDVERNKFVRTNHEYLIEQIQFNQEIGISSPNLKQNLALEHPCKSMYWVAQLDSLVGPGTINDRFNYTTSPINCDSLIDQKQTKVCGQNLLKRAKLVLNGRDRFGERFASYFNLVEPYQHHYRGPKTGINMYSFSLYPENHQPSATANMSRIDYISMQMQLANIVSPQNTVRVRSYTINYNILRICFGLGGLVFA